MYAKKDALKSTDAHITYFTSHRIALVTRLLTSFVAVTILTVPVIVLYDCSSVAVRLAVIAIFASDFALFVSWLSSVRLIEVFSATAA